MKRKVKKKKKAYCSEEIFDDFVPQVKSTFSATLWQKRYNHTANPVPAITLSKHLLFHTLAVHVLSVRFTCVEALNI